MSEIMTKTDVAEFLKIPPRTIDYLVSTNQIPYSRLGKRSVRFDRDRLMKWFSDREGVEFRLPKRKAN